MASGSSGPSGIRNLVGAREPSHGRGTGRDPGVRRSQLDRDAARLYEALSDLVRVYQFRDRDKICCHDISVTQCYALEAVARLGPRTLNELAAELYLDKSTASRVVSTLERKAYVTRQTHPDDRRAVLVDLTATGRRLLAKIQADLVEETRQLLHDFEPAVRDAAPRLLDRLARAAERRLERTSCAPGAPGAPGASAPSNSDSIPTTAVRAPGTRGC